MLVSILSVLVVVQSRQDHGTTCTAACRCRKGVIEKHAILCQCIDMWRVGDRIAVAAKRWAFVVGYEENDVAIGSFLGGTGRAEIQCQNNAKRQANGQQLVLNLVNHSYPVRIVTGLDVLVNHVSNLSILSFRGVP